MKSLRSALLWLVGGGYMIAVLLFVLGCSFVLPPPRFDPWLKAMFRFLFRLLRIPVEVKGLENIPADAACLFMANHVSIFDIPLLAGFIPGYVRGVEAERQFRWPLYGAVIRRLGNIPITRSNPVRDRRSFEQAVLRLRSGQSLVVLPEGHRTLDGRLRPFKKMPFFMAKQAGAPIVPVGLSGLFTLKRKGGWHIHPHPVRIHFGAPIGADCLRECSVVELRDRVRAAIEALVAFP